MKGNYEEFQALRRRKNKANSKPIKANFVRVNDSFVIPAEAGYVFSRGKTIPKACGFEAATQRRPADKKNDLKKQSQFAESRIGATSYVKRVYGNKPASGATKNKANQSQFMCRQSASSFIMTPTV